MQPLSIEETYRNLSFDGSVLHFLNSHANG